jgi:hypothetical protein
MLKINFLPDSDLEDISEAIKQYEAIWNSDGEKIVKAWEEATGYLFKETFVNATIWSGRGGHSHPLALTAWRKSIEEKKNHIVHELGHRILLPPKREHYKRTKEKRSDSSLENHKILDLVLYDVYELIYGKEFADYCVNHDSKNLPPLYKEAWDFALSFKTKEDRQKKFKEMMSS